MSVETNIIKQHLPLTKKSCKKTWNTDYFNKKLTMIANGKKTRIVSSARAKLILSKCVTKNAAPSRQLSTKNNFFSMVDNLPHHICAMKMVVSSGNSNSFSKNVIVKDYIANLAPQH